MGLFRLPILMASHDLQGFWWCGPAYISYFIFLNFSLIHCTSAKLAFFLSFKYAKVFFFTDSRLLQQLLLLSGFLLPQISPHLPLSEEWCLNSSVTSSERPCLPTQQSSFPTIPVFYHPTLSSSQHGYLKLVYLLIFVFITSFILVIVAV